jgi:hypothetical protein
MRVIACLSTWVLAGCVQRVPVVQGPPAPSSCPAAPTPSVAANVPALHDLGWRLRVGEADATALPSELHAFAVGPWECALGAVHYDDTREADQLRLLRSRKLACTHANGTTVQSALACELVTPIGAGTVHAASLATRVLPLALDTAPALALSCTPLPVDRLSSPLGSLCASALGVQYCSAD